MKRKTPSPLAVHRGLTFSRPKYVPPPGLRFHEEKTSNGIAVFRFSGLRFREASRVLLAQKPADLVLRQVLAAGFCAWTLRPGSAEGMRQAMRMEAALELSKIERYFLDRGHVTAIPRLRSDPRLQPLLTQLFYPMGGLGGLVAAYRSAGKRTAARTAAIRELWYLVNVVSVCHAYLAAARPGYAESDEQRIIEMDRLRSAVKEIGFRDGQIEVQPDAASIRSKPKQSLTIEQVRNYWKAHAKSLAFAYAALRTPFPKHHNLLAAIFADEANGPALAAAAAMWLRRAEYARRAILEKIHFGQPSPRTNLKSEAVGQLSEKGVSKPRFAILPDVKPLAFRAPKFAAHELVTIKDIIDAPRGNAGKRKKARTTR